LSTTGVYGDHGGDWVTETSGLRAPRLATRVAAEKEWLGLVADGRPVGHVFRLAGIYGPGRSAIDTVRRGAAQVARDDVTEAPDAVPLEVAPDATLPEATAPEATVPEIQWVSRIHVDDIGRGLLASAARPYVGPRDRPGAAVYNVADDQPAPRGQVLDAAAALLGERCGAPGPLRYRDPGRPSGRPRAGGRENKRVGAARLREVGWAPWYTNYEEGLRAILDEEES
jgi:nucleoside-diphosphate-sugar epimerase